MAQEKKEMAPEDLERFEGYVERVSSEKDRPYVKEALREMILNNAIPLKILRDMPLPPREVGKTRFDQLYAASMALVFPGYRETTLGRLLGPEGFDPEIKIFRAIFPEKFKVTHILLRARTYQEAFALACDYACRVSLRLFKKIPPDLTIRVLFMSESSLRRHLSIREVTKTNKRQQLKMEGRQFTDKQLRGARLAALGPPSDPNYSIFKYSEVKDLTRLRNSGVTRTSAVETESFRGKLRKT